MSVEIDELRDDDHESHHEVLQQAFGMPDPHDPDRPRPSNDRMLVIRGSGRIVAAATTQPFGQWHVGRAVPMGGLAGVVVAPEARGNGYARLLTIESLRRMHERDEVISALYPTTETLYRSCGYEAAGNRTWSAVPVSAIPTADMGDLTVRRADWDVDVHAFDQVYRQNAQVTSGWLDRTEYNWALARYMLEKGREPHWCYLAERDGEAVGTLIYRHVRPDGDGFYDLTVEHLFATDPAAMGAMLGVLGSHGTIGGRITTMAPRSQLASCIPDGTAVTPTETWVTMLRLVDVPGAFAARAAAGEGEVHFHVTDAALDHNDGPFVVRFADGAASAEPGGSGSVAVDITTLASLYSGHLDAGEAAAQGRLAGATDADIAALRRGLAGPQPTIVDFF